MPHVTGHHVYWELCITNKNHTEECNSSISAWRSKNWTQKLHILMETANITSDQKKSHAHVHCQVHIMFGVKFTSCLNIDITHKYSNPIPPTNPYPFSTLLYILDYSSNPLSFLLYSLPFLFTHHTALHSLSAQPCIALHSLAQPHTASIAHS